MKITFINFLLCLLFFPLISRAQPADTTGSTELFQTFMTQINPKHVNWVKSNAKEVNEKKQSAEDVKITTTQYAVLGSLNGADIEALAFLVLMQAAKSAQEDLKAIMARVKEINKQKEALRHANETMKTKDVNISPLQLDSFRLLVNSNHFKKINTATVKPVRSDSARFIKTTPLATRKVTKAELDEVIDKAKSDLDSMSEMGEMESLRLQIAMDRMSKMMSTLSNLLKKISDTQNSIIQNLK